MSRSFKLHHPLSSPATFFRSQIPIAIRRLDSHRFLRNPSPGAAVSLRLSSISASYFPRSGSLPGSPCAAISFRSRGRKIASPRRAGFINSTTAPRKEYRPLDRRGRPCFQHFPKFLLASPSFHGGRGALPSAGGHPSDLTTVMAPVGHVESECITNIYHLGKSIQDDDVLGDLPCSEARSHSLLDILLLSQWEDHALKGNLRYDVSTCQMKIVSGAKKFIAQLNENWNLNTLMDFEKKSFQARGPCCFSDVKPHREDLLICVTFGEKEGSELVSSSILPKDGVLVIANANPVEYGHIFLVPYDVHKMPQLLDKRVLGLMTQIAAEVANSSFHIFVDYDGSESMDHRGFQASYFADPLPVELLPSIPVYGNLLSTGIYIGEVADYTLKALVFVSKNFNKTVQVVGEICAYLCDNGSAFSLLISDCGKKVFLFPQVRAPFRYKLSAWECGGYFVYDTQSDFNHVTESYICSLLASVSLDAHNFKTLKQQCCTAVSKFMI
ncbi:hypothetical protein ZIOFF_050864 [Zingiber officinale]|uniref:GDP-L-galactose phosphorylase 1 n=1 Tax=Zingiber officinale TaxID=94328 RepID=A0A8J5KQN1_ZINOF|nr:hypothetical protein ZIOFF_050864 [Zingiber officinale]